MGLSEIEQPFAARVMGIDWSGMEIGMLCGWAVAEHRTGWYAPALVVQSCIKFNYAVGQAIRYCPWARCVYMSVTPVHWRPVSWHMMPAYIRQPKPKHCAYNYNYS